MTDVATVVTWLRLFIGPGQVTELRALDVSDNGRWAQTHAGYFDADHLEPMAKAALSLHRTAVGVYFVPNPINPALLARCANKVRPQNKDRLLTTDKDIVRRHWMLVDCDPVRPDGISATDAEKAAAWDVAGQVKEYLWALDYHEPVIADSGNGYHLLYRIDLPVDDGGLVKITLNKLADDFDNDRVLIDRKVFNPARIVKLYGTTSRKGDDTPDRPHRESKVLSHA